MRLSLALVLASLLASCTLLSACAASDGVADASSSFRLPISGGKPDNVDSNVFLLLSERGPAGTALCTASLIAPNLLLTARHCVSEVTEERVNCGEDTASAPLPASTLFALNAASADEADVGYRAASVNVPSEGSNLCGFDLALITLTTNVPASSATPLVPRIERVVERGERYSAVGYGLDAVGDQGTVGRRRARAGLIVSCIPGKCGEGIEASEFVGQAGVCSGDSGGPALDEAGKIVGVVSRSGGSDCAHPVYGSVASWKDWLSQVAEQAAEAGGYVAPFWVKTGQSDPPAENEGGMGAGSAAGADGGAVKLGRQGEKCSAPEQCAAAFACYSPTSSPSNAYCSQFCSGQSDCPSGSACSRALGVCIAKPSSAPEASSCALHAVTPSGGPWLPALGATCALLLSARRRKRASVSKRDS